MLARLFVLSGALLAGGNGQPPPFEPDPIFDTVDLNATYVAMRRIFARMRLSPREMAVLIGGGHSSGKGSLEGGTYHGNWIHPMTPMGNAYFQLLTGHKQWCAVLSSDNRNAHFVAKGTAAYIAETEYSPMVKHEGKIPCVETGPDKALFENLPTVPVEDMTHQPGTWHKPSGAAAMLPVDFALQYSHETYQFVIMWAASAGLFFQDFTDAWVKLVENGQELRCPNVNGPSDFGYSAACAERFGQNEASYQELWGRVRSEIKNWFDGLPERCNSTRPQGDRNGEGSVCPSSVLRLGFHISATYDPDASGNIGGSSFANFLGPCKFYDGCAGCLWETQVALQRLHRLFPEVSLADVSMYAAGLAAAYLAEFKLNTIPFHPGRLDMTTLDDATCAELGARLPSPAYQAPQAGGEEALAGMLRGDLTLPPKEPSTPQSSGDEVVV